MQKTTYLSFLKLAIRSAFGRIFKQNVCILNGDFDTSKCLDLAELAHFVFAKGVYYQKPLSEIDDLWLFWISHKFEISCFTKASISKVREFVLSLNFLLDCPVVFCIPTLAGSHFLCLLACSQFQCLQVFSPLACWFSFPLLASSNFPCLLATDAFFPWLLVLTSLPCWFLFCHSLSILADTSNSRFLWA